MTQTNQTNQERINQLAATVARSVVAVIEGITQRGAWRGEELLTIGQLREQCVQINMLIEAEQQEAALQPTEA